MEDMRKVPVIRFKGFSGEWERLKLGDLGSVAMNRRIFKEQTSINSGVPFYKIGTFGGVPDAYISKELFEDYKSKYPYPETGDILISASGSIGRTVEYLGKDEYFQDSNIVWLQHDMRLLNIFLKHFYSIIKWKGLEGSTIKRLYNKSILETDISLPSTIEQSQIGTFFQNLESLITLRQRKYDKLTTVKKAMLEKMFPKEGADVPKIRFKGFTEKWEPRTLGEVIEISSAARVHKNEWTQTGVPFFRSSDVVAAYKGDMNSKAFISIELYQELTKLIGSVQRYDVLVTGGGSIGIPYLVESNEPLYFKDADLLWFKKSENINGRFLYTFFTTTVFRGYVQSITHIGTISHYTIEQAKSTPIKLPNLNEQNKIEEFFQNLDSLITLQQRELDKLKNIKKACLEKMFV